LCFLHLRNVKGFVWNHKRVYRIYCGLELNLQNRPEALAVPDAANHTWSMDFMIDQLADGPSIRTLNRLSNGVRSHGRIGTSQEIAGLALYLASDDSAFTTGQTHAIDGGWAI